MTITNLEMETSKNRDSFIRPLLASIPLLWVQLLTGSIEGHSAVLLPQLEESDKFRISLEEESWIASLGIMATPLVAVFSGPMVDRFGRKFVFYVFYVLASLGFSFIAFAQAVEHIYIGRILGACAHGLTLCSILYIYEVCAAHQRNRLLPLLCPVCSSGILYAYVIGGYLPWNIASLVLGISGLVGLVCLFFIPESPAWLVKQGNISAAIQSLEWLKRDKETIANEVDELKKSCFTRDLPRSISFQHFVHPTVWKPFVILIIFSIIQNGTGFYMLLYYTVNFFQHLGTGSETDPLTITVGLALLRLISGTFGAFLMARCSRKKLAAFSVFGMFVAASAAVAYLVYFGEDPRVERPYQWFPILCSIAYVLLCTLAIQPLPWLMTSELYPLPLRGIMSGMSSFALFSIVFLGIKAYPFIMYYGHITGLLCIFATSCFVAVFFAIFLLPETLNRTPQEIGDYFMGRKKTSRDCDTTVYI